MKNLKDILTGVEIVKLIGKDTVEVSSVVFDSRKATAGSLFVAIKGSTEDGSAYIKSAIESGAKTIVCEVPKVAVDIKGETVIYVKSARKALALIAQNFFDNPSRKMKIVGVTGTNGKTTTATLLYKLYRNLGYHAALISTVENKIDDKIFPADHTTPDPVVLASFLNDAVTAGCQYVFMECSSHAIYQNRIDGMHFTGAIFTNLTLDHLDFHKTFDAYAEAKKGFFDSLSSEVFAVANADDGKALFMLSGTKAAKHFVSLKNSAADFKGSLLENSLRGIKIKTEDGVMIESNLVGEFNAYNIYGIYAAAVLLGESKEKVCGGLKELSAPTGRLEFIESKAGIFGVVDYAHTPDALENVLRTLNNIKNETSTLVTVVGCGGDRDKTKRPIMGGIATKLSGYTIFTSDNPRTEDPVMILSDIAAGVDQLKYKGLYEVQENRADAIKKACARTKPGDIVLVAGKGHEPYQIFKNETIHFSDMEELQKYLS